CDGRGTVEVVGGGGTGYHAGAAVSGVPSFSMSKYGMYGDAVTVPASGLARHPASLSWTDAAAAWMQYLTAYGALIEIAAMQPQDTVLIPAASSSVGLAAIQITRMVGAVPVALTRGGSKRAALQAAGAAHVIATTEQDLVKEVRRITDGKGARVVFDPVGGPTVTELTPGMSSL